MYVHLHLGVICGNGEVNSIRKSCPEFNISVCAHAALSLAKLNEEFSLYFLEIKHEQNDNTMTDSLFCEITSGA